MTYPPFFPSGNPLELLDDNQLYQTQLALDLACGRAKSVLRRKHRVTLCFLGTALGAEADRRGKSSPTPPFSA